MLTTTSRLFRFSPRRPRRCRPQVEALECRTVPAAFTFDNPVIATNNPMAVVSHQPTTATSFDEVEAGDDFILAQPTQLQSATFTGLLPAGTPLTNVTDVTIEIYRVFPNDSNVTRTSGPGTTPPFQTANVPTRQNSPSDVVFDDRDSGAAGELTFTPTLVAPAFTAANSVTDTGIHPKPNQTTGGDGPQAGEEVTFNVTFTKPFDLPADHYFFVPQVQLTGNPSPGFLWLAATRPNPAQNPDLQAWIRNSNLNPDWLRIGTDIVGGNPAPTFNLAFSLAGQTVAPSISSLSPAAAGEGGPSFTLTVNGSHFQSGATVLFNGTSLATTFVSDTQLTAVVPASLIAHAGTARVTVSAPAGTSGAFPFPITDAKPALAAAVTVGSSGNVTLNGSFADAVSETHFVLVFWGDGSASLVPLGVSGSGSFSTPHRYRGRQAHRAHTITVLAFDDEFSISNVVTLTAAGSL
ncbi:MAG TPA: IPT/TIG domain-containing protein [Gemmataceae bacterium]|nr:IPT/TIG domain-containing protein [Gemmataceae bacterium]